MQYTEASLQLPPLHQNNNGIGLSLDLGEAKNSTSVYRSGSSGGWPGFPTSSSRSSLGGGFNTSAGCMEQLLVHCANAIECNDATLAQQLLWVLHNIAPPDGDPNQRLTAAFLRALLARASRTGSCQAALPAVKAPPTPTHRFTSPLALAAFVDLTPWHRFGYTAANAAILEAVEGFPAVHLVDLSTTHCMQIPTLIDALAARPEGPPFLKLTVVAAAGRPSSSPSPPPRLDVPYDELGRRLVAFARSKSVEMEFRVVPSDPSDGFASLVQHLQCLRVQQQQLDVGGEALVVNCQMLLHYVPEETTSSAAMNGVAVAPRTALLEGLRGLNPVVVTVVEEDVELTDGELVGRLRAAFNYLWIPYDAAEATMQRGSERRRWYEAEVGWKVENVVACEGGERVERGEGRGRWAGRMVGAGFRGVPFGEEAVGEVKGMLDEHAAGWGMKREDEHRHLVLTWKGHHVVFASAWVPR